MPILPTPKRVPDHLGPCLGHVVGEVAHVAAEGFWFFVLGNGRSISRFAGCMCDGDGRKERRMDGWKEGVDDITYRRAFLEE